MEIRSIIYEKLISLYPGLESGTRVRVSWHRKVMPRSLEDTSQKKRATLLTASAILCSMLELVLNSRHAQIPQGIALE